MSARDPSVIVGIVHDIREGSLDEDIWPAVYYPFNQGPANGFSLAVCTTYDPQSALSAVTTAIHKLDPSIATFDEATMSQRTRNSESAWLRRSSTWLAGAFGGTALLLGEVGLYGMIAYSVARRTREIVLRMALGASRASIYQMILGEAGKLMTVGAILGIASAESGARLIRNYLFGTQTLDVVVFAIVTSSLIVSGIFAAYIPARREASINPADCLRAE
jgi:predicted lysophospholipase L1 biosynthesis ABC-type transport system permease subunit